MPEPAVPIVPLHVNVYLPPQPTPQRCYDWGKVLGEILRARPERLVLMGVGWDVALPRHRPVRVEFDYDRRDALAAGEGWQLAAVTGEQLDKMGNIELARGPRCSVRSATPKRMSTAMSLRGITATRLSSGRYDGRAPLSIAAGVRLSPQPLSLRSQVRQRIPGAVPEGRRGRAARELALR